MFTWLKERFTENIDTGIFSINGDSNFHKSCYVNVFNTAETDTSIISCAADEEISITDVHIYANGNAGEIDLDFDGGNQIVRAYTNQITEIDMAGIKNCGDAGQDITFTGDATGADVFVLINYVKVKA